MHKARLPGQSVPGIPDWLVSAFPAVGIQVCATMLGFLCECFCGKHLTDWDISLAPCNNSFFLKMKLKSETQIANF